MRLEMESLRGEIRDMSVRMTEERILASAGAPVFGTGASSDVSNSTMRSLADVPGEELMTRLQDLAAEMNAAQSRADQTSSLKAALGAFAEDVKALAPGADRSARLKSLGKALDRHAEEIETHAADVEPSATALRTELHAITSELRTVAARAQSSGTVKDGPALRETAIELGARAESLFTYLANTHHDVPDNDDQPAVNSVDDPSADIATLARLIAKLEARAEHMSQSAVAARFDDVSDELSPAEREAKSRNAERKTGGIIHTVFESIERLNNIAAALARANDVERQRKAAH
jgi:phage shock protein A